MLKDKQHIKNLLIWLRDEVYSSCGDGDAWWQVGKFYELEDILELVKEVNETEMGLFKWNVDYNKEKEIINWGEREEAVIIFKGNGADVVPPWAQCVITL